MASPPPVHIMGAGLSGLAAATTLAKAGIEVHVHDIREDSGARVDGDFQALENWSQKEDFFDQLKNWGYDSSEFKATEFSCQDLYGLLNFLSKALTAAFPISLVVFLSEHLRLPSITYSCPKLHFISSDLI